MPIDRLRAALLPGGPAGLRGDWDVTADTGFERAVSLTPAAVLIAITNEAVPQLLLTRRNANMTKHPGQIAFPGGRVV